MDGLDLPRSALNSHVPNIQPRSLSSLADDASTLTAAHHQQRQHQQPLADPNDVLSLRPLQPAIENYEAHHHPRQEQRHLQNVEHPQNISLYMRQPRPGEPVNTLLMGTVQHLHQQSSHQEQRKFPNGHSDQNAGLQLLQSSGQHLQIHQEGRGGDPCQFPVERSADGHFKDMKMVPDPPDLDLWRERLFNVDEIITLSEDQFRTYFPHIDNVYSHRSTQRYKRKPFVSHYWDCRLKGRPPGTPKSDDPNKRKRKRTARQRDLCDVKIKITEYFPGYGAAVSTPELTANGGSDNASPFPPSEFLPSVNSLFNDPTNVDPVGAPRRDSQPFGVLTPNPPLPEGHPGAGGERFFTIQRVNGNGANGKNDGLSGGHRHTLEDSDRVKKNSVQRYLLKEAKERKKSISAVTRTMPPQNQVQQKMYHTKATGLAAVTVINHTREENLQLFGSCFCPFVQRVWIALEAKGIPYQYIEVDPYEKPDSLLEVNPRGLVPALRHGDWGSYESSVLLEYLEDLNVGPALLPRGDAKLRAHCRLWTDHINRHIVPNFYRVLQEQDEQRQVGNVEELRDGLNTLIAAAHPQGPFFLGSNISFVDIQLAPWILRLGRVLKPYRGWPDPEPGSRWDAWVNAIEANEHVKSTTSSDELYLDSYERYAHNCPNTSQVANAINSGRGLP